MTFGASPSDIIIVVQFCRDLYRKCRAAGWEYDEIGQEVRGLHNILKSVRQEIENASSPLNQEHTLWGQKFGPAVGDCYHTLRQLDQLLQKSGERLGSDEMDTLGEIRVKMISHKTNLEQDIEGLSAGVVGNDELGSQNQVPEKLLDMVDAIAERLKNVDYEDNRTEIWRVFKRELIMDGVASLVLEKHKNVLLAYIHEISRHGPLGGPEINIDSASEDAPPSFSSLGTGSDDSSTKEMVVREESLKFPQSMKLELRRPETRRNQPEMSKTTPVLPQESDNKISEQRGLELGRQETRTNGPESSQTLLIEPKAKEKSLDTSSLSVRGPVTPQVAVSDEKEEVHRHHIPRPSTPTSDSDNSITSSAIIRTSDLLALTRALQLRAPNSPSSFRGSISSLPENVDPSRSAVSHLRKQPGPLNGYGSSPSQPDAMAIPTTEYRISGSSLGTSPQPEKFRLKPDEHGNEILPDAKWTKINRTLVSPEVLMQDGRRFEASPDFVAVLGILSRAEIEALAARSQVLRASRGRRSWPVQGEREARPVQPPRPIHIPLSPGSFGRGERRWRRHGSDEFSSASSDSSSSYELSSDSDLDQGHRRSSRRRPRRSQHGYPVVEEYRNLPTQATTNAPLSPVWSPNSPNQPFASQQAAFISGGNQQAGYWATPPNQLPSKGRRPHSPPSQQYPVQDHLNRERERNDREGDRAGRRRPQPQSHGSHYSSKDSRYNKNNSERRDSSRDNRHSKSNHRSSTGNPVEGKRRWKENLAAGGIGAGIGGAAVTLLNVLSEAAEAL